MLETMFERDTGFPSDGSQDYTNRAIELKKIGENFLFVCFDVENLYEDYLLPHWEDAKKSAHTGDPYYNENQRKAIENILNRYKMYMKINGECAFPKSPYIFQLKFFSFLHSQIENVIEDVSKVVPSGKVLWRFKKMLKETYETKIHNINFTETSANEKIAGMFDEFYLYVFGIV